MISVKICGITNPGDAEICVKAGARALGFVFYGLSPRAISPGGAREICQALPAGVKKVGVFVNMKKESVLDTVQRVGLDMAQLSGDELVVDCQWLAQQGVKVVRAIRPRTLREVQKLADYRDHVFAFNIDAFKEGQYGGTGQVAEWSLAKSAKQFGKPVILAGGLTGGNVVAAIRAVEPSALDVCSGVEKEPGKKDPKKIKGFFEALWRFEEELRAKGQGTGGESARLSPSGAGSMSGMFQRPGASVAPKPMKVVEAPKPDAPAAAPAAPKEPEPVPLADSAGDRDHNDSGAFMKLPEEASKEEPPLVDWASASAAVKKPPNLPPPGGGPKK